MNHSKFTTTEIIAREGWRTLGVVFVLFLLACAAGFGATLMLIVLLLLIWAYRNPERMAVEGDELALVSPVDGRIVSIERERDIEGKHYLYVKIRSLPLVDCGFVRFPASANLVSATRAHGLFLPPYTRVSEELNERVELRCEAGGEGFLMRVRAGMFARKIYLSEARGPIRSGSRVAFMLDGTLELFLPQNVRLNISNGDSVKAGESVLGYFAYKG
jgi:phosphatidylserine decarboxylase